MAIPLVFVQVSPSGAPAEYPAALVVACTQALDKGACELDDGARPASDARAIAIVTWQGVDQLSVRIQVGLRREKQARWVSSDMTFQSADDRIERWRAVGYAIRTLVGEWEQSAAQPAPIALAPSNQVLSASAPSRRDSDAGASALQLAPLRSLALGPLVGPGLNNGAWRGGGWIRGTQRLGPLPVFATVSFDYAIRPGDALNLGVQWATVGAGLGGFARLSDSLVVRAFGEFAIDHVRASVSDPTLSRLASSGVWREGVKGGLMGVWPATSAVAATFGVEGWTWNRATVIRVEGVQVGKSPPSGFSFLVGAQVSLP
jgi:hypothetical protein